MQCSIAYSTIGACMPLCQARCLLLRAKAVLRVFCCADPATLSSPAPGSADMVAYEQKAGLRPANDHLPDQERRQQVCLLFSLCLS